ncbi:hypothetical protein IWQ62_005040 [Dispira parvispora]|uniref:Phospholipid scramblase n=1 Tax=Dispira parvispora TaxID=1520584 RepID=A0A9W8AJL8_9FUNG|nr:hypothetical protein IWQ62_005040 [Dispira parvispora]
MWPIVLRRRLLREVLRRTEGPLGSPTLRLVLGRHGLLRPKVGLVTFSTARSRFPGTHPRGNRSRLQSPLRPRSSRVPNEEASPVETSESTTTEVSNVVRIPEDPHSIVQPNSSGSLVLSNSALVMTRQLEMLNIFVGFEQANKYAIMDPTGNAVGYVAEQESFKGTISRQLLRTHRPFHASILDKDGNEVFQIYRPFSFINSRIYIKDNKGTVIGEVHQEWHLWKRRYDLFVRGEQFARIDGGFLTWDFDLVDEQERRVSSINRNFSGFAREIFTDTGQYVVRLDAADGAHRGLTLDERAVALACAVTIDVDYFSRHSNHHSGGLFPFPMIFPSYGGSGPAAEDPSGPASTSVPDDSSTPDSPSAAPSAQSGNYGVESPPDDPFLPDDVDGDDDGDGDWSDWFSS